ncbi:MAG TPA: BamA/TamA family outer membrane protein [Vicinamibacterales bacterium]|nr:BamA/TamA family outer membrane protein [Vicinamibacterales bacterium]
MTRTLALIPAIAFASAITALAQEATRPEPTHEKFTVAGEPKPVTFVADFVGRFLGGDRTGDNTPGFYPAVGRIVSGAGWISIGPGYRQRVLRGRAVIDGSAAISLRAYKQGHARFEFTDLANSRVAVGTQVQWQDLTQVHYFGNGPDSPVDGASEYRMKTTDVVGYGSYRPTRWLTIGASGGRLDGPTLDAATGPLDSDYPDARLMYQADPAFALERQPSFAYGTLSVTADTRDYADHPSRGGLYRAAFTRYSDLDLRAFTFNQYEAEGAQFVPLLYDGVVLAFHGWTTLSDTADGQTVPVYLMPSLGGTSMLRAFPNYRFHDRNFLVVNAEARIALTMHIDTALFVDAGSVAPRVGDLRIANASYGLGLRLHTHKTTTVRLDAGHGREGWRVSFSLNDPFRLSRLTRKTAVVPFAP